MSPDTTGLVQATVPGGHASSVVSLPPTGAESCSPGMMNGAVPYNLSLVDPGSDVPLVAFPIYPLPAGCPQIINQSILFQNTCIYYTVFTGIHVYILKYYYT